MRVRGRWGDRKRGRTVWSLGGEEDESLVLELLGTLVESLGREESGGHGSRFGCSEVRGDGFEASGSAEHATIPWFV